MEVDFQVLPLIISYISLRLLSFIWHSVHFGFFIWCSSNLVKFRWVKFKFAHLIHFCYQLIFKFSTKWRGLKSFWIARFTVTRYILILTSSGVTIKSYQMNLFHFHFSSILLILLLTQVYSQLEITDCGKTCFIFLFNCINIDCN